MAYRFAIKSLSSDPQMVVLVSVVYNNSSLFKVDVHCTMKLLVPLWFVNLYRALAEDDSPLPPLFMPSMNFLERRALALLWPILIGTNLHMNHQKMTDFPI